MGEDISNSSDSSFRCAGTCLDESLGRPGREASEAEIKLFGQKLYVTIEMSGIGDLLVYLPRRSYTSTRLGLAWSGSS